MRSYKKMRAGFTLIEIVVVIALASMLLAAVLTAVSAAQQSTRDSQRRAAVSQVETALEQWGLTHSNNYKNSLGNIVTIGDLYGVVIASCSSSAGVQYLDTGITVPGTSNPYDCPSPTYGVPTSSSQISIADRSGSNAGNNGYCVRVKLESGPGPSGGTGEIYGATDTNRTGHNMNGGCTT